MSRIYISNLAHDALTQALAEEGHELAFVRPCEAVSEPISAHPDILLCKLGTSPETPIFQGVAEKLGPKYPDDVPYNAVVTESFLICNSKTISYELACAAKKLYPDIETINVPQGYTKCNLVVVDSNHFITEDEGIYRAIRRSAENCGLSERPDCLLVSSGYVELPGYDRGFIGGTSGKIGDVIWFNGDLEKHPEHIKIRIFIENCGLSVRYFKGYPLVDIGSIIEEKELS